MRKVGLKYVLIEKVLQNGKYHLYLRVTYRRKQKIYGTGLYCKKLEWSEKTELFKKNYVNARKWNILLKRWKAEAEEVVSDFYLKSQPFDFDVFSHRWRNENYNDGETVIESIQKKIEHIQTVGGKKKYQMIASIIKKYKGEDLKWDAINEKWLKKFVIYLRKERGCKDITIKTRMANLQASYNYYEKREKLDRSLNPFTHFSLGQFKHTKRLIFLTSEELKRVEAYEPTDEEETLAKNVFIFSVYTRGMNFKDMCLLKWSNITQNKLEYKRAKTNHLFTITLMNEAMEVLEWAKGQGVNNYVFPIFNTKSLENAETLHYRVSRMNGVVNRALKKIGEAVGIKKNLTTYSARHTFASLMKERGVSIEMISEMLGHKDLNTTQVYLKAFNEVDLAAAAARINDEDVSGGR